MEKPCPFKSNNKGSTIKINDDEFEVRCLPTEIYVTKKPSIILQNYLKQKQKKHEAALEEMINEKININQQIDILIRKEAEGFKRSVKILQNDIKLIVSDAMFTSNQTIIMENYSYEDDRAKINECFEEWTNRIVSLQKFFRDIECERCRHYKKILKNTYKKLMNIAHKTPIEIEHFFEKEIIESNEITLSNIRTYKELIQDLKVQCKYEFNRSYFASKVKQQNILECKKAKLIEGYKNMKCVEEHKSIISKEDLSSIFQTFDNQNERLNILWANLNPIFLRSKDLEDFVKQINKILNRFYVCSFDLLEMYKTAHSNMYSGYLKGLDKVKRNLNDAGILDMDEIKELDAECLAKFDGVAKRYNLEYTDLRQMLSEIIENIQQKLKQTVNYLLNIASIWDDHFDRLEDIKRVILEDLRLTIVKNDRTAKKEEKKLNTALDAILQGSDVDIDEHMAKLYAVLESIKKMYNAHYNSELGVLNKYREHTNLETKVIIADLQRFIHFNPKNDEVNPTKITYLSQRFSESSETSNVNDIKEHLLTKHIQLCNVQATCVNNWMFGLEELLNILMVTMDNDMEEACREWIEENSVLVLKRLEVKLSVHEPRYASIKNDCYDLRKEQLNAISDRMKRHESGINKIYDTCTQNIENRKVNYDKLLKELNTLEQQLKSPEVDETLYEEAYTAILQKINNFNKDGQKEIEKNYMILKKSQLEFLNHIRFFFEPGNCQAKQGIALMNNLKKISKQIDKKFKLFDKQVKAVCVKQEGVIQKKHGENLTIIQSYKEELHLNEDTVGKIKHLQHDIKQHAYYVKLDQKKISTYVQYSQEYCNSKLSKPENFEKLVDEVVTIFEKTRDHLVIPEKLLNVNKSESKVAISKTHQLAGESDYLHLLFEHNPTKEDQKSFVAKAYAGMYESFKKIQEAAQKFYATNRVIRNTQLLQPTYDQFMKEVFDKYCLYQTQIETCWASEANKFLEQVTSFQDFVSNTNKKLSDNFDNKTSSDLSKTLQMLKMYKVDSERGMYVKFLDAHRKLKPYFGHPLNTEMYEEALATIDEFTKECCESLQNELQSVKEKTEEQYNQYCEERHNLDTKLHEIEAKAMNHNLFQVINNQCLLKIKQIGSVEHSKSTLKATSKSDTKNLTTEGSKSTDLDMQTKVAIQNLYEDILKVNSELESLCEESCEKWRKIWYSDLEQMKKLYKVKYDPKNDPTK